MSDAELDPALLAFLLNKRVLVGLTYINAADEVTNQRQVFGVIVSVEMTGIKIRHPETGAEFNLPPDFEAFKPADPGVYTLRSVRS